MELEVRPPLGEAEHEALRRALAAASVELAAVPPGYNGAWRRSGVVEAVDPDAPAYGLGALAAEDTRRDARVVEP